MAGSVCGKVFFAVLLCVVCFCPVDVLAAATTHGDFLVAKNEHKGNAQNKSEARGKDSYKKQEKANKGRDKQDKPDKGSKGGQGVGEGSVRIDLTFDKARELALASGGKGYETLPPGIRKNLARGKSLPPGIAKKSLPGGMLERLPVRSGYEWLAIGTDLVLIESASGILADVLADVFK